MISPEIIGRWALQGGGKYRRNLGCMDGADWCPTGRCGWAVGVGEKVGENGVRNGLGYFEVIVKSYSLFSDWIM